MTGFWNVHSNYDFFYRIAKLHTPGIISVINVFLSSREIDLNTSLSVTEVVVFCLLHKMRLRTVPRVSDCKLHVVQNCKYFVNVDRVTDLLIHV